MRRLPAVRSTPDHTSQHWQSSSCSPRNRSIISHLTKWLPPRRAAYWPAKTQGGWIWKISSITCSSVSCVALQKIPEISLTRLGLKQALWYRHVSFHVCERFLHFSLPEQHFTHWGEYPWNLTTKLPFFWAGTGNIGSFFSHYFPP